MRPLLSEQGGAELAEEVPTAKENDLSDRSFVLKLGNDLLGPASSVDGASSDRREWKRVRSLAGCRGWSGCRSTYASFEVPPIKSAAFGSRWQDQADERQTRPNHLDKHRTPDVRSLRVGERQ